MHTYAWMAWVAMVMALSLTVTNPLYLAVVLLGVVLVAVLAPRSSPGAAGLRAAWLFGLGVLIFSFAVAAINGSAGSHELFSVPGPHVPTWLGGLRFGGPVTAEGLVYNGTRALAILSVFVAFAAFSGAVSPARALRTAPSTLFHAGLAVTIGLTLLPSTIEDLRRLREIQALRGIDPRWWRLPGLVVPAVLGGLERSMRLAEAMEARGYSGSPGASRAQAIAGALSAPLSLGAAYLWLSDSRPAAAILGLAALACLGAWMFAGTRRRIATRLRDERPGAPDIAGIAVSAGVMVSAVWAAGGGWAGLDYNPFGGLPAPEFSEPGAVLSLAVAWPALQFVLRSGGPRLEAPGARLEGVEG